MKDGVVYMENLRWVGELGGVPVVMGGENRGLRVAVNSENEGLDRLIGGLGFNLSYEIA